MPNAQDPTGQIPADPATGKAISRKDLEARIIAKAWRDPNYQAELLADPKAVLQSELSAIDPSITLPDSLAVHVHPEAADVYHLVEPRNPNEVAAPGATDAQLSGVSPQTVAVVIGTTANAVVLDGYIVLGPISTQVAIYTQVAMQAMGTIANASVVANSNMVVLA